MAGMFCGGRGRRCLSHKVDELHCVFVYVLLAQSLVPTCYVRQNGLIAARQDESFLTVRVIEGLAVQLQSNDSPLGSEDARLTKRGNIPCERTVNEREQRVAEVQHDQGIVVGITGVHRSFKVSLFDADSGHCSNTLRRPEDSG